MRPRDPVPGSISPAHWQHLKVLVVEDHPTYRTLMSLFLQKFGLSHEVVCNGQLALNACALSHFDLVISDCRMPVMDGYSMAREIRRRERAGGCQRVPIIALTANPGPDDYRRCEEAGMDAWLPKPLTLDQLRSVLEQWLPLPGVGVDTYSPLVQSPWPTRADLIATFGDEQMVNQMLHSLRAEADADFAGLARACHLLDRAAAIECLHRLVGGLVFLGGVDLDTRAVKLIEQVRDHGIALNQRELQQFEKDVMVYLRYLTDL